MDPSKIGLSSVFLGSNCRFLDRPNHPTFAPPPASHLQNRTSQGFSPLTQAYNSATSDERNLKTGICMRTWQSNTPHRFPVDVLVAMDTITTRHPDIHTSYQVINGADGSEREAHWEPDIITGELCPPPAGEITPILELDPFHPGRWYLETYRKFDLKRLTEMYRCGFCTEEFPEGRAHKIWYRKFPGGWKDTPQGRVIFHSLHNGTPLTWQGRYPEIVSEDGLTKRALNPYSGKWDILATRGTAVQAWMPAPPFDEVDEDGILKFRPAKYKTAKHSGRELMGWDAAIKRADEDEDPIRWCVLTEGPLDGARVGPGGLTIMGKSLSRDNAAKVASNFHLVITAFDNDKSGKEATSKIAASIHGSKSRDSIISSVAAMPCARAMSPPGCQRNASAPRRTEFAVYLYHEDVPDPHDSMRDDRPTWCELRPGQVRPLDVPVGRSIHALKFANGELRFSRGAPNGTHCLRVEGRSTQAASTLR